MNKKIITLLVVGISLILTPFLIGAYVFQQSDALLKIQYICITGMRSGSLDLYYYDNGTYTIDMNSCAWIKNINYTTSSQEYQEINRMSCDELLERHSTGGPYQNNENRIFAQEKISNCNYVKDFSGTK